MSNIAYWNPFKTLQRLRPNVDVEAYLRGYGPRVVWTQFESGVREIRLDVSEDDAAYHIKAEIPGADKHDIDLSVEGNSIRIAAEIKREPKRRQDEKSVCNERRYGKVSRCFSVPSEVDAANAQASYENGVLTVILPKKSGQQTCRVGIA